MSLREKNDVRRRAARLAPLAFALATSLSACTDPSPPITSEPRETARTRDEAPLRDDAPLRDSLLRDDAPLRDDEHRENLRDDAPLRDDGQRETQGARASTFTFESKEIGFKMAVAYPEGGHLCIIVPESAQDPMECIGVDAGAMLEALPTGRDRPFGVAYARTADDWSYFVMMSTLPADLEAREDIREFVGGAEKAVKEAANLPPKLVVDSAEQGFDLFRVKDVPVVRFRLDAPYAPAEPGYDTATTLYYAAYGKNAAMVTFLASPKDIDKLMPYAEASLQTLELPARESPDRFGKPRAELHTAPSTAKALAIFGPLIAAGVLLFWWLGTRKSEDKQPEAPPSPTIKKPSKSEKDEAEDPGEDAEER